MKHQNLEDIRKDFTSKLGIKKGNNRHKKKPGGKGKKDRWGGLSRKQGRKADRKKKKQLMNTTYLTKFSKRKGQLAVPEELVQRTAPQKKAGKGERISRYAPANSSSPLTLSKDVSASKDKNKDKTNQKSGPAKQKKRTEDGEESASDGEVEETSQADIYDAVVAREQQQLRQLEKKLKLKKKRKSLPKAFIEDGLDYLLDVVDPNKLKMLSDSEVSESESDTDIDSEPDSDQPEEVAMTKKEKRKTEQSPAVRTRKVHFADEVQEEDMEEADAEEEDGSDEGNNAEMDDGMEGDEEEEEDENEERGAVNNSDDERLEEMSDDEDEDEGGMSDNEEPEDEQDQVREDIYGRLVDGKGNLVMAQKKADSSSAYIPPGKRAAMLADKGNMSQEQERLKKQMKGLLNRASEANIQSIANAVEDLYMSNSRASVNESLFTLVSEAIISRVLTPEKLIAEMAMLVAILHGNVGSEVGAFCLQRAAECFEELRQQENYGAYHTMDNVVLLLANLYKFKVAHHSLVFEIITMFVESFTEKDIEMLLCILRSAGFNLRRDDPEALSNQITAIQGRARTLEEGGTEVPPRMRFMMEMLMAVRNNNIRRVPGADVERSDRLRKLAGTFIRGGGLADNQLNVGLKDLLGADKTGRWWIVGSAWEGRAATDSAGSKAKDSTATSVSGAVSQKLVRLGKKLGMNTDVRRSIFYVIMSSEDYLDAFQKVLQLGLKGQQEREIVIVSMECCKQESTFNPFYAHLLERLAKHDRKFMMALQFHWWDSFRAMGETKKDSRHNLAMTLSHLLASEALTLGVLKVLEFGALEKSVVKFLKATLTQLLTSMPVAELNLIFRRIGQQQKLRPLADGMRVFLTKYVKVKKPDDESGKTMKYKLEEVCAELSINRQTVL